MPATSHTLNRSARLDFRLGKKQKQIIEKAAATNGQSISDFAVTNLIKAAQATINQANITKLTMRDQDIFVNLLEADVKPNQALKNAAKRYKQHG